MEDTGAACNSLLYWTVTPVWWNYMAHIFLCLFIFPKSNHSSPYDDDVAPDFLEHPPTGPRFLGPLGYMFAVSVSVYMFAMKPNGIARRDLFTTPLCRRH